MANREVLQLRTANDGDVSCKASEAGSDRNANELVVKGYNVATQQSTIFILTITSLFNFTFVMFLYLVNADNV